FNKEVELELIPLRYPYHDSNILAQLIGLNSKKYNFNRMLQKLFKKANIITKTNSVVTGGGNSPASSPYIYRGCIAGRGVENLSQIVNNNSPVSQLTGIKIRIAGRLTTQRIVPKSTVKTAYKGNLSSNSTGG